MMQVKERTEMDTDWIDWVQAYHKAIEAYERWCKRENIVFQQPSDYSVETVTTNDVPTHYIILKNISAVLARYELTAPNGRLRKVEELHWEESEAF